MIKKDILDLLFIINSKEKNNLRVNDCNVVAYFKYVNDKYGMRIQSTYKLTFFKINGELLAEPIIYFYKSLIKLKIKLMELISDGSTG